MTSPRASFLPRSGSLAKTKLATSSPDLATDMFGLTYSAFDLIFELAATFSNWDSFINGRGFLLPCNLPGCLKTCRTQVSPFDKPGGLSRSCLPPSHRHSLTSPGWPLSVPLFNPCLKICVISSTKLPKEFLSIFFICICALHSGRPSRSGFPYPHSKCCLSFDLLCGGMTKQYFIVQRNYFWLTTRCWEKSSAFLWHPSVLTTGSPWQQQSFPSPSEMSHSPMSPEPGHLGTKSGSHPCAHTVSPWPSCKNSSYFEPTLPQLWKLPVSQISLRISVS